MSGSVGNTAAQIAQFENTYGPLASSVGTQIGVDPSVILAQWGLESAYGTSNVATTDNNLAGITNGSGSFVSYSSPSDFAAAFVQLIENSYPNAENAGNSITSYVAGLTNSAGSNYYGTTDTASSYAQKLGGVAQLIQVDSPNYSAATTYGAASTSGISGLPLFPNQPSTSPLNTIPNAAAATVQSGGAAAWLGNLGGSAGLVIFGLVLLAAIAAGGIFTNFAPPAVKKLI